MSDSKVKKEVIKESAEKGPSKKVLPILQPYKKRAWEYAADTIKCVYHQ